MSKAEDATESVKTEVATPDVSDIANEKRVTEPEKANAETLEIDIRKTVPGPVVSKKGVTTEEETDEEKSAELDVATEEEEEEEKAEVKSATAAEPEKDEKEPLEDKKDVATEEENAEVKSATAAELKKDEEESATAAEPKKDEKESVDKKDEEEKDEEKSATAAEPKKDESPLESGADEKTPTQKEKESSVDSEPPFNLPVMFQGQYQCKGSHAFTLEMKMTEWPSAIFVAKAQACESTGTAVGEYNSKRSKMTFKLQQWQQNDCKIQVNDLQGRFTSDFKSFAGNIDGGCPGATFSLHKDEGEAGAVMVMGCLYIVAEDRWV
eukprot:symbB.v1.2.009644.t1/scaffold617.1/size180324/10